MLPPYDKSPQKITRTDFRNISGHKRDANGNPTWDDYNTDEIQFVIDLVAYWNAVKVLVTSHDAKMDALRENHRMSYQKTPALGGKLHKEFVEAEQQYISEYVTAMQGLDTLYEKSVLRHLYGLSYTEWTSKPGDAPRWWSVINRVYIKPANNELAKFDDWFDKAFGYGKYANKEVTA
jgi:hypothetical protein